MLPFLTYSHYFQRLQGHVFPPEARESLVPDTGQQLLHVGMGYKLFEGEKKNQEWKKGEHYQMAALVGDKVHS